MKLIRTPSNKLLFIALILAGSCTKDFEPSQQRYPLIQTIAVTNIDDTGAQFNARVIKPGTDPVLDFGFKYVERPTPLFKTVTDTFSVSIGGAFENNFSIKANHNLTRYLSYNVMAYVVIAGETVISNPVIFKSQSLSPIEITSFSPANVLDGDTLTIFGENFNRYGSDYVFIGSQLLVNVLRYDNKLVTVIVPPISQAGPINVTVDAFYSKTNSNQLIIINPLITSCSPSHGPPGQLVILNGRFSSKAGYNKVFFNGVEGTVTGSTKNQITALIPSDLHGKISIAINVNGKTFTAPEAFLAE